MNSLSGHLLVASPHLKDPNFDKTVVLMIQHTEEGALGVVLNRPGGKTIRQVWEQIDFDPCPLEDPVYVGGPVPGPIIAVHTSESLADEPIGGGLFASTQNTSVDALVRQTEHPVRLYSGHSGWGRRAARGRTRGRGVADHQGHDRRRLCRSGNPLASGHGPDRVFDHGPGLGPRPVS